MFLVAVALLFSKVIIFAFGMFYLTSGINDTADLFEKEIDIRLQKELGKNTFPENVTTNNYKILISHKDFKYHKSLVISPIVIKISNLII